MIKEGVNSMILSVYSNGENTKYTREMAANGTGVYSEAADFALEINKDFDIAMTKIMAITEACDRELEINLKKSELKCIMEDGTQDDLAYLEEAAETGALAKLKKIIAAIKQAFIEWVSKIKTSVIRVLTSAEARQTLNVAEKKIKLNPILSKKKVQIMDTKKPLGVINTYKSKCDKVLAKTVKGIVTESTMKTLNDTKEDFHAAWKKSVAGNAALITITVAALVAQLKTDINTLPAVINKQESVHTAVLDKITSIMNDDTAAAASAATDAAAAFRTELCKEEISTLVDGIQNKMSVLKKAVSGKKTELNVTESAEDDDFDIDDIFGGYTESAEDDSLDDLFSEDLFGESVEDSYEESYDDIFGSDDLFANVDTFDESVDDLLDDLGMTDF
jgi:hypothetical protein